jgi:hypothetical protein
VDGVISEVSEDADGRQWVAGYEGEKVSGVWLMPADQPVIVGSASATGAEEERAARVE